jgi:hypothetical protein
LISYVRRASFFTSLPKTTLKRPERVKPLDVPPQPQKNSASEYFFKRFSGACGLAGLRACGLVHYEAIFKMSREFTQNMLRQGVTTCLLPIATGGIPVGIIVYRAEKMVGANHCGVDIHWRLPHQSCAQWYAYCGVQAK